MIARADRMMDIIQGYNANTMSVAQMDSVLDNATGKGSAPRYRLEYKEEQKLFRHSFYAEYYLLDTQKGDTIALSDGPVRDAVMSPNGKYVVYAKSDNNLYIYKVDFKTEVAITTDTNTEIFNGISDWLYEEEFGVTSLFEISPDSKLVAFVRLNESEVPSFEWQTYLGENSYPQMHSLRYPRAGEANAKATVCVYDIYYKSIRTMQLPDLKDAYFPRLRWGVLPEAENPTGIHWLIHQKHPCFPGRNVWI